LDVLTIGIRNCIAALKAVEQAATLCTNHELCHQNHELHRNAKGKHENKFYKDRRWLFTEFPELFFGSRIRAGVEAAPACEPHDEACKGAGTSSIRVGDRAGAGIGVGVSSSDGVGVGAGAGMRLVGAELSERWMYSAHSTHRVLEIGCGAGNTVFPVLAVNPDPALFVYACDFAPTAVDIVRSSPAYEPVRCHAFVCNLAHDQFDLPDESLDLVILIFVLSALHPDELLSAVKKIARVLKPGGKILMRDYGRSTILPFFGCSVRGMVWCCDMIEAHECVVVV
jgi:SAM-dependent methyltransferase